MSENYADTIAALAVRAEGAEIFKGQDGREWLVQPGQQVRLLSTPEGWEAKPPELLRQEVNLQTADSLVAYVNRFKDPAASILFADIDRNFIHAQIDYHLPGGATQHLAHSANLTLPLSHEWKLWTGLSSRGLIAQLDMARFLDENRGDIVRPDGADMLEAVKSLQGVRNVKFNKAVRLDSENECFTYTDETNLTREGKLEVPSDFTLRLPVYFGGAMVELHGRLIHKLQDGQLFLGIKLLRADQVRQAEFKMVVQDVEEKTGLTAFYGALG